MDGGKWTAVGIEILHGCARGSDDAGVHDGTFFFSRSKSTLNMHGSRLTSQCGRDDFHFEPYGMGYLGGTVYSGEVDSLLRASRLRVLKTPYRAPQANEFCERLIGSARRECLDL